MGRVRIPRPLLLGANFEIQVRRQPLEVPDIASALLGIPPGRINLRISCACREPRPVSIGDEGRRRGRGVSADALNQSATGTQMESSGRCASPRARRLSGGDPCCHESIETIMSASRNGRFQSCPQGLWFPSGATSNNSELIPISLLGRFVFARWMQRPNDCEGIYFDDFRREPAP
jgi:hypothetical protein